MNSTDRRNIDYYQLYEGQHALYDGKDTYVMSNIRKKDKRIDVTLHNLNGLHVMSNYPVFIRGEWGKLMIPINNIVDLDGDDDQCI